MKNTLPKRLERLFAELGVNQLDFSRKIDFTQSYVSQILNGYKNNPSPRFYDAICREFNISPEWLRTGRGGIFTIPGLDDIGEDAELLTKYRLLPKTEQRLVEGIIDTFLLKSMKAKV